MTRLLPLFAGLAGVAAISVAVAAAAPARPVRINAPVVREVSATDVSANWSGYAVTPLESTGASSFRSVTATWKQPALKCPVTRDGTASAAWVGLGGYGVESNEDEGPLEQAGTSADCSPGGASSHYAWFEFVPNPPVTVKTMKVLPGDTITASVVVDGTSVLFWLKNRTRHTVFSKRLTAADLDLASAEWIAEAPSECFSDTECRQAALSNFGAVTFTRVAALATIDGIDRGGTISSPLWQATPLRLVPDEVQRFYGGYLQGKDSIAGLGGAKPSELAGDGGSFTVNWIARPKP